MNIDSFIGKIRLMMPDLPMFEVEQKSLDLNTWIYSSNYENVSDLDIVYQGVSLDASGVDYRLISADTGQVSFYTASGVFSEGMVDGFCFFEYFHKKFTDELITLYLEDAISYTNKLSETALTTTTFPDSDETMVGLKYYVAALLAKFTYNKILMHMGVNLPPDLNVGAISTGASTSVTLDSLSYSESASEGDKDRIKRKLDEAKYWKELEANYLDLFDRFMGIGKYKDSGIVKKRRLKLGQIVLVDAFGRLNPDNAHIPTGTMTLQLTLYDGKPLFKWTRIAYTATFYSYVLKRSSTPIIRFENGDLVKEFSLRTTNDYLDLEAPIGKSFYALFAKINPESYTNNEVTSGQQPLMSNVLEVDVEA